MSAIVAGAIRDEGDQIAMAHGGGTRPAVVEQIADGLNHLKVRTLRIAADIVALPGRPRIATSSSARARSSTKSQPRTLAPAP